MTEQGNGDPSAPGREAEEAAGRGSRQPIRLGGMALRNGLLIHGPTHWAAAVRDSDGAIQVASEAKPVLAPQLAGRVPLLRGPLKLAEAMAVVPIVRRRMPAARLPFEDRRVIAAIGATLVASAVLRRLRFHNQCARASEYVHPRRPSKAGGYAQKQPRLRDIPAVIGVDWRPSGTPPFRASTA